MKIPRKSYELLKSLVREPTKMSQLEEELEFDKKESSNAEGNENQNEKSASGSAKKSKSIYNTENS